MVTRLVSAGIGLIIMALVMFTKDIVLTISISLISCIAVFEALKAYGYSKYKSFVFVGLIASVLFAFLSYLRGEIVFLIFVVMIIGCVAILLKKHEEIATKDLFAAIFLIVVIPFSFSTLSYIRKMEYGAYLVWLPFISAWLTDSFAYFGGRLFGKNKLCEKISPKKTVEGAFFGVIGAIFGYIVYAYMLNKIWSLDVGYTYFILIALITSVTSQMGDLFASLMKRENNVKDFGNIMPGHGGILDRFDSLILTSPLIFICLKIITLIG